MTEPETVPGSPYEPASQKKVRLKRASKVNPFPSPSQRENPPGSAPYVEAVALVEPSVPGAQGGKRRLRFEERYDRITLYLEKPIHARVRELYDTGEIMNLSEMFNAAVKKYLSEHYKV